MAGNQYRRDNDVLSSVGVICCFFDQLNESFLSNGVQAWQHQQKKNVNSKKYFVEK